MQEVFKVFFKDEDLFCRSCSSVTPHPIYSRTPLDLNRQEVQDERLLASCSTCKENQIILFSDLRSLNPEEDKTFSCKIAGKGRITLGDWVYIPGHSRPGLVKSKTRVEDKECFYLSYEDGKQKKLILKTPNVAGRQAMIYYKLLPFQLGSTLVGDYVYHVNRNVTGRAVGVIHGPKEKIIVQLEDNTYLVMTHSGSKTKIKDNPTLKETILESINSVPHVDVEQIHIEVTNGIVYISGICRTLFERETLIRFIESIEGILAVIPKIKVTPKREVPDYLLQRQIQDILFSKHSGVIGIRISVERGDVELSGFIEHSRSEQQIYEMLVPINGIKNLNLKLSKKESSNFADMEKTRLVVKALKRSAALNSARINVHTIDGNIYLEGEVNNSLQKNTATFSAMWAGKNLSVINNLRIIKPGLSSPYQDQVNS